MAAGQSTLQVCAPWFYLIVCSYVAIFFFTIANASGLGRFQELRPLCFRRAFESVLMTVCSKKFRKCSRQAPGPSLPFGAQKMCSKRLWTTSRIAVDMTICLFTRGMHALALSTCAVMLHESLRKWCENDTAPRRVEHSSANVFRDLDDRSLTKEEQDIIDARVAAQRKLLEEREKRERARQVRT